MRLGIVSFGFLIMTFSILCRSPWFSSKLGVLIFFLLATYVLQALVYPLGSKVSSILLLLLGLGVCCYCLIKYHEYKDIFYIDSNLERFFVFAFALFSIVSIISFLYWPHTKEAQMQLEDYGTFLLLIPLFLVMRAFKFNFTMAVVLLAIAGCLLGLVSITQYVSMKYFGRYVFVGEDPLTRFWLRPSGGVNPMRYAGISLTFACFALNAKLLIRNKSLWLKILLVLAIALSLIACLLTKVRGTWLAFPVLLIFYCIYLYKAGHLKFLVSILLGGGILIFAALQTNFVQQRVDNAIGGVNHYFEGRTNTSIGARIDMFRAAVILISERPLWGYGLNSYAAEASALREEDPRLSWQVGHWYNPHNEILHVMVEKGLVGLITLILIFAAPASLFIKALYIKSSEIRFYAMSGLSILIVYAVAGQSVALFGHDVFNHFFVLMILLFVSQISFIKSQDLKLQS